MTPVNIFFGTILCLLCQPASHYFGDFVIFQMRPKVRMSMMNIGRVKSNRRADEKGRRFALTYIQLSCSLSLLARPVSQLSIVSSASFPLPTLQWFCAPSLTVNRRKVRLRIQIFLKVNAEGAANNVQIIELI